LACLTRRQRITLFVCLVIPFRCERAFAGSDLVFAMRLLLSMLRRRHDGALLGGTLVIGAFLSSLCLGKAAS